LITKDQKQPGRRLPESEHGNPEGHLPPAAGADASAAGKPAAMPKLTPEEQMALFEKELKENDWGHQPC
jgi:hypothetical protein